MAAYLTQDLYNATFIHHSFFNIFCFLLAVWMHILRPLERMRKEADLVKMFPSFKAAEELFGLTDQNVVKVLESVSFF